MQEYNTKWVSLQCLIKRTADLRTDGAYGVKTLFCLVKGRGLLCDHGLCDGKRGANTAVVNQKLPVVNQPLYLCSFTFAAYL